MKPDLKIAALFFSLLPIIPIWYFDYLPLQDYPNHLARLNVISDYGNSDFYRGNFQIGFLKGTLPLPYLSLDIFVAKFMTFLDVDTAMRVFISLYIIMYVTSLYLLSRDLNQDFTLLLLINLPVIYSWFFYLGYLNFLFSIPLFLFAVRIIDMHERDKNRLNIVLAGLISIFIYLTHIFTFFVLLVFLSCYLFKRRSRIREHIYLLVIISTSLLYGIKSGLIDISRNTTDSFSDKFKGLFFMFFNLPNDLFIINSTLFACAIAIIVWSSYVRNKLYLISSFVLLLVYIMLPRVDNGIYVFSDVRAMIFSFIMLSLSLQINDSRYLGLIKMVLVVVSLVSFSWLWASFSDFNKNFSTKCADQIENRSAVLPVDATKPEGGLTPYIHSWGYFFIQRELLTPYLFQHAHIPIKYKHALPAPSSYWAIKGNESIGLKLIGEIRETYDYILLVGKDSEAEDLIGSISHEVCTDRLVSLYKIEKDRR